MRARRRAQSVITWTVTLSLVITALLIIRPTLKRESEKKMRALTDYSFWGIWGNAPQDEVDDKDNIKVKSRIGSKRVVREREEEGVIGYYVDSPDDNYQDVDSASLSVAEGAEPMLKVVDLNEFSYEPGVREPD